MRDRIGEYEVAIKVLRSVDEFGMDMICADEFNAKELVAFHRLLKDIGSGFLNSPGLLNFLNQVIVMVEEDDRFKNEE